MYRVEKHSGRGEFEPERYHFSELEAVLRGGWREGIHKYCSAQEEELDPKQQNSPRLSPSD